MTTLEQLNDVFRHVFDDEDMTVTRATKASDVEDWDSIAHVSLLVSVEKAFRVKFSSSEIASLNDVGALVDLIETKVKAKQ